MCVIIYKPAWTKLPDLTVLDKAHERNPHGCGFCSPRISFKGLSYDLFRKRIIQTDEKDPVLIHFRFATHGSVKRSNCHPFYDKKTGTHFMHNGVLYVCTHKDKTDSECAFDRYLKPALKYGIYSWQLEDMVNNIIGSSRFAFMQGYNVAMFGDFYPLDGCFYSNLRFL